MRILVTGCAGFIGSNLVQRCLDRGWDVFGVDDLSNGHTEFLPKAFVHDIHRFFPVDFAGRVVTGLVNRKSVDAVIHLAAVPRVSYSVEHPIKTNDVNVSRTLKLMDVCRSNVKRFVFASSSSVYGGADVLPTHENQPKRPKSPYALQKSIVEDYLAMYSDLYGLDSACLRFFNVFGNSQIAGGAYATAVSSWLNAIHKGLPMRSDGDGTQSRDMCYVDNVTDACARAASADGLLRARCYNVACGERVTNAEILAYLLKRYPNATMQSAPWRPGDVMHTQADIGRISKELGYSPLVRFWEGLELTIDWYERNWDWVKNLKQSI
jgi:nucleoside-diphosphate-sugar epimerase